MDFLNLTNILELILLAGVMLILIRFIFMNYTGRVRKPQAWVHAVKEGRISSELLKLEKKYDDRIRLYNIWLQIERLNKDNIPGDLAELGVYKGKTAKIIQLCKPDRKLHLFDTFNGFPDADLLNETGRAAGYTPSHFSDTSVEKVEAYLGKNPNIIIHQGYFPETARAVKNISFAFVNLDADLHQASLAGLEFFYPRLSPGGIIMIHDYNSDWPGLMHAVDSFCKTNNEYLIPVADADNSVMIIKRK
jgi:O-methyltransferase